MELKRTLRERKFIKAYIENSGNATKAYMAISSGMSRESAVVQGHYMLRKVNVTVTELLDEMGITDVILNKKLGEGLDATKVISVVPIPPKKTEPGTGDLPDANSKNIEFVDVPDFNVRVRYLDMAYKLKDAYPKEKVEHSGEVKVDLNLEGMEIGEIQRLIRALEAHTRTKSQGGVEEEGDKGKPV